MGRLQPPGAAPPEVTGADGLNRHMTIQRLVGVCPSWWRTLVMTQRLPAECAAACTPPPPLCPRYLLRSSAQAGAAPGSLPDLAGLALLGSVPPSGNKQLVGRFLRRDPLLSLRITW